MTPFFGNWLPSMSWLAFDFFIDNWFGIIWAIITFLIGWWLAWRLFKRPFISRLEDCQRGYASVEGDLAATLDRTAKLKARLLDDVHQEELVAVRQEMETAVGERETQIGELNRNLTHTSRTLSEREEEVMGLQARHQSLESDYGSLQSNFSSLELGISEKGGEVENLNGRVRQLETELSSANGDREEQGQRLQTLQGELDEERSSNESRIAEFDARVQTLEGEKGHLEGELGKRDTELESLQGRIGELESSEGELRGQVEGLNGELAETRGNLQAREGELDGLRHRIGELEQAAEAKAAEAGSLSGDLDALRLDLGSRDEELSSLKLSLGEANDQKEQVGVQVTELRTELDAARGQLSERDQELASLQGRLDEAKDADSATREEINQLKAEIGGANDRTAKAEKDSAEQIATLKARLNDADDAAAHAGDELSKLKAELEAAKADTSAVDEANAQVAALKARLNDADDAAAHAGDEMSKLKAEVGSANDRVAKAESDSAEQIATLKTRLNEADDAATHAGDEISQLRAELESAKANTAAADEATAQVAALKVRLNEADDAAAHAGDEISKLKKASQADQKRADDLAAKLAKAEADAKASLDAASKKSAADHDAARKELATAQNAAKAAAEFEAKWKASQKAEAEAAQQAAKFEKDGKSALDAASKQHAIELDKLREELAAAKSATAAASKKAQADVDAARKAAEARDAELAAAKKAASDEAAKAKKLAASLEAEAKATAKAAAASEKARKEAEAAKAGPQPTVETGQKLHAKLGSLYEAAPDEVDDLKQIKGVAGVLERRLNEFGVYRFRQIADWQPSHVAAFSDKLAFSGRVERDEWIPQCQRFYESKYLTKNDPKLGLIYSKPVAQPDDLASLPAISAEQAKALHAAGVNRFDQIADWNESQWNAWSAKLGLSKSDRYEDWVLGARQRAEEARGNKRFTIPKGAAYDASRGFIYKKKPAEIDDLKEISGVGAVIEDRLNKDGVYRFDQIASWNSSQVDRFNEFLSFKGRIERDQWILQARRLNESATLRQDDPELGAIYTEEPSDRDDLTELHGVDARAEENLNQVGYYQFDQLAAWDEKQAANAAARLGVDASLTTGWRRSAGVMHDAKYSTSQDEQLGLVFSRRPSQVDDLKEIKGIATVLEGRLHDFGVYRFDQIANWDKAQVAAFSERIGFKDRVERDDWIPQARRLHEMAYLTHHDAEFGLVFTSQPSVVDKLDDVSGIDSRLAAKLNEAGIYRFEQIADWDDAQWAAWSKRLGFKGDHGKWLLESRVLHDGKYGNGRFTVIDGADYDSRRGFLFKKKPGQIDDLKEISGVAKVLEGKLNEFGVYRFQQIAQWSSQQVEEFGELLAFPDRIRRDQWILQARRLHEWGHLTEEHAEYGRIYREEPTDPDELTRLSGLNTAQATKLNQLGIWTFDQCCNWSDAQCEAVAQKIGVKGGMASDWRTAAMDEYDLKHNATIDDKLGLLFSRAPRRQDDLKRIYGVAKVLEGELHKFGVFWFSQIANWSEPVVDEFAQCLTFPDRVWRDDWIGQCTELKDMPGDAPMKKPAKKK